MKKSSDKKQASLFDKLKSFYQSRYGKMTLFFGFYFFFFLFLILNFNLNNTNTENNSNENNNSQTNNSENNSSNDKDKPTIWEFNTLIRDNYTYNYYINENGNNLSFTGKINETNNLVEEYSYNYFLNLYNLNQIIKNSKFLEKKELEEGYQYNYEITNKSLGELLDNNDLSSEINQITIYTNSDFVIDKIDLDLSSYMQELNKFNEYKITLQYEKVKE